MINNKKYLPGVNVHTLIAVLLMFSVASCSYIPFMSKKKETPRDKPKQETTAKVTGKGERIEESEPKPGDIKVIDGVDYIYTRNRRYMLSPYEPEYVWVRKDQYSPSLGEALMGRGDEERKELEKRIAKLEKEAKQKGISGYMGYPAQVPSGLGYTTIIPITFTYPSPKMKRRVVVLPIEDQTNYKKEHMGDLATRRLISKLEGSGGIICVDPNTINHSGNLTQPAKMKTLNELYGIQAVLTGALSDLYTSTSKIESREEKEASFAMSRLSVTVYNTETGSVLKKLSGRNPISLSREKGDLSSEKAKIKAIDLTIDVIGEDLLKSILSVDWHARIASIEENKFYINAGRLSNLAKGDTLEVYTPGETVVDPKTGLPLGKLKGTYKGELEIVELFGVDASWAKAKKGSAFSPTDLVYLKAK